MGLSQGAWVSLLAKSLYPDPAGIVWLSGPPMTPAEQGHWIVELGMLDRGWDEESVARAVALDRLIVDVYRRDDGWDEAEQAVEAAAAEPWFEDSGVGLQERDSWNWRWYRSFMDYDPLPEVAALDVPLLAIYGERDVLVPPEPSAAVLERLAAELGVAITVRLAPDVQHDLRVDRDSDWPALHWTMLEEWFVANGLLRR